MPPASHRRTDDPTHGLGPTRARMLALLQDAGEPLTAVTAGARLGLHPNSARFHLEGLVTDGLVERRNEARTTPGRPNLLYAAATGAPAVAHRSYRLLAQMLTSILTNELADPAASAEVAGQAWGRALSPATDSARSPSQVETLDSLVKTLLDIGFDSYVVDEADSLRLEISHCPFLEIAETNDVVCSVHLGLLRGILGQTGSPVAADTLEPLVEPSRCIAHLIPRHEQPHQPSASPVAAPREGRPT